MQAGELRQRVENLFGDAVAEPVLVLLWTEIGEWQHGNRGASRGSRWPLGYGRWRLRRGDIAAGECPRLAHAVDEVFHLLEGEHFVGRLPEAGFISLGAKDAGATD